MEIYGINFCECGCWEEILRKTDKHYKWRHKRNVILPLCACGCGNIVNNVGKIFIHGHRIFLKNPSEITPCWCKGLTTETDERLKKKGEAQRGIPNSEESKIKLSNTRKERLASGEIIHPWIGRHHTKESLKKMSTSQKEYFKTHPGTFTGKHVSEENKIKQSEFMKERLANPEDHPNWKGGISSKNSKIHNSIEYKTWVKTIFKRDDRRCHRCNNKGKVTVHHIINFSKLRDEKSPLLFDPNNGITFCIDCHKQFHSKYGKKNNSAQQIYEFIYENH